MPTSEKALAAYLATAHRNRRRTGLDVARRDRLREILADGKDHSWTVIAARCGYATPTAAMAAAKQQGFWPKPPSVEDL